MVCHALLQCVRLENDALDIEVIEVRMDELVNRGIDKMFGAVVQSEGTANMRVASKVEENRT